MSTAATPDTSNIGLDAAAPEDESWTAVAAWRKSCRRALIAHRRDLDRETRTQMRDALVANLCASVPELSNQPWIGFYWPIQGELDLRHFIRSFIERGCGAALPVVVQKRTPVEFWHWTPKMRMQTGPDGIPHPPERERVRPTALLIPLVGFDPAGYRLGYGAGYYDRTLAALDPKPLSVGVGLELGRLPSIHPQPHDVPLDVIVTEAGTIDHRQ